MFMVFTKSTTELWWQVTGGANLDAVDIVLSRIINWLG